MTILEVIHFFIAPFNEGICLEKQSHKKILIKEQFSVLHRNPPCVYDAIPGKIPVSMVNINQVPAKPDVILAFLENREGMEARLPQIKPMMKPKTLLWLCNQKGTFTVKTDINRDSINSFCIENGMRGIAMISINDDWSALRLKPIEQNQNSEIFY
ncbi:MAG: DUF3052 domain-containing protein [Anaerolineaceae bacterium]